MVRIIIMYHDILYEFVKVNSKTQRAACDACALRSQKDCIEHTQLCIHAAKYTGTSPNKWERL